jgi:DNA polymerase elongation subunit (family B)
MGTYEGWLLDVYIKQNNTIIWIKTIDGKLIRLKDTFINSFYIEPKDQESSLKLINILNSIPEINCVTKVFKFTSLKSKRLYQLLKVKLADTRIYRDLINSLKNNEYVRNLYNVDLKYVQKYLFEKLNVEPTSKVLVECKSDKLINIHKIDDEYQIFPPPFSIMFFNLNSKILKDRNTIKSIQVLFENESLLLEGSEEELLENFIQIVNSKDPDLLYSPKADRCVKILGEIAKLHGLNLEIGRYGDQTKAYDQGSFGGRILLGNTFYGFNANRFGVAGIIERTRFSFVPIGLATRWLSNKSIDSRNCYELIRRGYVIPKEEYFEPIRDLAELTWRDRGGVTFSPETGRIHMNVAAIDFDSQYPSIILKNRLSYEDINYSDSFKLMPYIIQPWLERRLRLKKLIKNLKGDEKLYCEERLNALKLILVTFYGISGCCWNRFGNVATFEEINRISRNIMYKAKKIAENKGFRIIYGDVDSLFVTKKDASIEDYEMLVEYIRSSIGLSVSIDKHFKFIVFLQLKNSSISALKRYYGITYEGDVEARGIELRRIDTPLFIRDFQMQLIKEIFSFNNVDEIYRYGVYKGIEVVKEALSKLNKSDFSIENLAISKRLRKNPKEYKVNVAHKIAALQLKNYNKEVEEGDLVYYIYKNNKGINRVSAYETFKGAYSLEEYTRLLISSAETIYRSIGINLQQLIKSYNNYNLTAWSI